MKKNLEFILMKLFASTLTLLTIFTVNSACSLFIGQPNEPSSLNRYKKV